jgi:acyl-coenzyme A thioesterase PaaI-like protein
MRVPDPAFEARVRESFGRQRLMELIGARLRRVAVGQVEIEAPIREDLSQQHGYLHAGVVTALVDSACGYSALTLSLPGTEVLATMLIVNGERRTP